MCPSLNILYYTFLSLFGPFEEKDSHKTYITVIKTCEQNISINIINIQLTHIFETQVTPCKPYIGCFWYIIFPLL